MERSPRPVVATTALTTHLFRGVLALLVALVSVLGVTAGAAAADPPNQGTVKIDEETLTSDGGPSNNPKPIGCTFAIDFYNFPAATATALISFENKSPGPGSYEPVSTQDLQGPREITFATSDGPGSELEHTSATYTVNPSGGLTALPNGDILLKVTVTLAGDKNFRKHKVFKLECLPATPPPPALVPDLALTKTGTDSALVGGAGSYTLGVANAGTAVVTEPIVVTDTLPAGVTPTAASGAGFVCSVTGQLVSCTRDADLAAGEEAAPITVSVTFGAGAVPSVLNTARVTPVTGETVLGNNEDSHPTTVTAPVAPPARFDLAVDKTGPATAVSGSSISYVINVVNNGPDASPAFVVTDELSAGQTATAVNAGTDYACGISANGRTVTCTRAEGLAAGQSAGPITVTVAVGPGANDRSITDTASVPVLTGDTDATNNTDTVTTTVPGQGSGGGGTPVVPVEPVQPVQPVQPAVVPVQPIPLVGVPVNQPASLPDVVAPPAAPLPDITGVTPNLPAQLPVQQVPPPAAPVQAPVNVVGAGISNTPLAAARPAALPFTGAAADRLLLSGLLLLLLGAAALLAGARTPRSAR